MTNKDKPVTDEPVEEAKVEESGDDAAVPADDAVVPADDTAAPADDAATVSAGTDQRGRQLYDVKCATCGKDTQVPFKPSGDRPVYCRDCYMKRKG